MFENNYFNTQENTTAKSPFSVYAEENHKLILPEKRTSLDEIDFLLDKGYIGENEKLMSFLSLKKFRWIRFIVIMSVLSLM